MDEILGVAELVGEKIIPLKVGVYVIGKIEKKKTHTIALFVSDFQLETTFEQLGIEAQKLYDVKEQNLFYS
jgi:hypothetical protein